MLAKNPGQSPAGAIETWRVIQGGSPAESPLLKGIPLRARVFEPPKLIKREADPLARPPEKAQGPRASAIITRPLSPVAAGGGKRGDRVYLRLASTEEGGELLRFDRHGKYSSFS